MLPITRSMVNFKVLNSFNHNSSGRPAYRCCLERLRRISFHETEWSMHGTINRRTQIWAILSPLRSGGLGWKYMRHSLVVVPTLHLHDFAIYCVLFWSQRIWLVEIRTALYLRPPNWRAQKKQRGPERQICLLNCAPSQNIIGAKPGYKRGLWFLQRMF